MTQRGVGLTITILVLSLSSIACSSKGVPQPPAGQDNLSMTWPGRQAAGAPALSQSDQQPGETVTVVIALSSFVPAGIVGHAGIAVEEDYWDFGPTRTDKLQPVKSIRSPAGPWWDDPDQQWAIDRNLTEVLADMPDKVHPMGSIVAVIQVQVTDEQAQAITDFWHDTYIRMQEGEDMYCLSGRQCASMIAWSLRVGMQEDHDTSDQLPRDLHMMSPTRLYKKLHDSLVHTAGPGTGQPAEVTLWQLDHSGLSPWQRGRVYEKLALPELPRIRLAYERLKHLPMALLH